ncbi:hypothetical protein M409DRAFT_16548 [Zasmidium cellare ATCC 36951]|uniref:Cytochrome P450 n=1 Tax=Zasmidium cellare ATCC 36951 TaxID=1080233 RepID=A0A6A6D5F4_ZASCE|nr:uncharacterized protein M409DRAFT_16548 [Zasmidium cellare ATCC 36951]KAF2174285.1 hypothetical protein M409DRAFT_16548 [Zasmidium cellare ATCC 36951]
MTYAYSYVKSPAVSKLLKSVLGEGLVVAEGDQHRVQRKILQPAFKLPSVKELYPLFWRKTKELARKLQDAAEDKNTVDVLDYNNRVTLDIVAAGGFGMDIGSLSNPKTPFYTEYMKGFLPSKHAQVYRLLALIFPEWILDTLPLKRNQELRGAVRAVGSRIREKVADLDEKSSLGGQSRNDIMDVVRRDGNEFDTDMLVNQCLTFLGAGHDTIAQSLNWAIYELSVNKNVQERLRQEVKTHVPEPVETSEPDADALACVDNMPYLAAVCNEIIRLHPPIHHLHRQAVHPVNLCGHELPKGSKFIISIGTMNRSPELWSTDPSTFDPDRWVADPNGGMKDRQAFLSFSQGPRSCIGERFARAEMAFIIAGLVQSFDIDFAGTGEDGQYDEVKLEYGTTTRFESGLFVRLKRLQ